MGLRLRAPSWQNGIDYSIGARCPVSEGGWREGGKGGRGFSDRDPSLLYTGPGKQPGGPPMWRLKSNPPRQKPQKNNIKP